MYEVIVITGFVLAMGAGMVFYGLLTKKPEGEPEEETKKKIPQDTLEMIRKNKIDIESYPDKCLLIIKGEGKALDLFGIFLSKKLDEAKWDDRNHITVGLEDLLRENSARLKVKIVRKQLWDADFPATNKEYRNFILDFPESELEPGPILVMDERTVKPMAQDLRFLRNGMLVAMEYRGYPYYQDGEITQDTITFAMMEMVYRKEE